MGSINPNGFCHESRRGRDRFGVDDGYYVLDHVAAMPFTRKFL